MINIDLYTSITTQEGCKLILKSLDDKTVLKVSDREENIQILYLTEYDLSALRTMLYDWDAIRLKIR